jgi:replicative DNA helicase
MTPSDKNPDSSASARTAPVGRIPPHSAEAERGLLGSILLDPQNALAVAEQARLTRDSFFVNSHQLVFEAIVDLAATPGAPVDYLAVAERLRARGQLEAVGGTEELARLVDATPTAAHAQYYTDLVADAALRRGIIRASDEAISASFSDELDANDLLANVEQTFLSLRPESKKEKPWKDVIGSEMREIYRLVEEKKGITGLSTGFVDLDQKLQGLHPGEMIVLAARPSMGKTSLAMNIAENVAMGARNLPPTGVAVFSLEMTPAALARRMLCGRARVRGSDLVEGNVTNDQMIALGRAAEELAAAPIYVDNTPGMEAPALMSSARRAKLKYGIGLVVIDYLQLMNYNKFARDGRQRETAAISQMVKALATELDVPVIVLSQLSRNPEMRERNAVPRLSDLRDSGAIEQDADVVLLLRRPCKYPSDKNASDERLAIVDVAKQRNGATGEVQLDFDAAFTRFGNRAAPATEI